MSRTSVGVPAFSWSVLVMAVTIVVLEDVLESLGQDAIPNEAFDEFVSSQGAIRAGGGANDRKNSSTCSKQPRKISWKKINKLVSRFPRDKMRKPTVSM